MKTRLLTLIFATCCWLALPGSSAAQTEEEDLAKTVQNPLASLVSLPFQANYNLGVGQSRVIVARDSNREDSFPSQTSTR